MIYGHPERSEIMVISQAFIFRFLLSNVIIMLVTLVFFLMKRLFKKQIPARGQYQIWIIYLIMLTIPFLPFRNRTFFPGRLSEQIIFKCRQSCGISDCHA